VSGSNGSSTVTVRGTVAAINSALRTLMYGCPGGLSGSDQLNLALSLSSEVQAGGAVSTTAQSYVLNVGVAGLPVINVPSGVVVNPAAGGTILGGIVVGGAATLRASVCPTT